MARILNAAFAAQQAAFSQQEHVANMAAAWSATLGTPAALGNSPEEGDVSPEKKERRADPERILQSDLLKGDVIQILNGDQWDILDARGNMLRIRKRPSGEEGDWVKEDTPLKARGVILLNAPKLPTPTGGKKVGFDSVIVPDEHKKSILDTIKQVDNHNLIFEQWGFSETFEKGTAISMLFWGPPGTGKTLMGQAIADHFNRKLEVVSTAEIETPEPGGAERAIKAAFEKATNNSLVLLFDECDGLVSSRKHMGAIMAAQVNTLLMELEKFTGIVVFTTNRINSLDEAFDRRLSLKLEFSMPSPELRAKIWKRMFPARAPLADDVDFEELATVEIAGGHIKNVVLKAARAAANSKDKKITQQILVDALIHEVETTAAYHNHQGQFFGNPLTNNQQDAYREKGRLQVR